LFRKQPGYGTGFCPAPPGRVEADIANVIVRIAASHTSTVGAIRRRCRSLTDSAASSRFHLSEYQELTPARDNIDFAEGTPPAPRQNAESLCDQESGGAA
jgi:hypothetical protein